MFYYAAMRNIYHCSPQSGITVLEPRVSRLFDHKRVVYMTSSLPMALMYAIRHYEYTYGYHWKDGQPQGICYEEYFEGALETLYGGKSAWIYHCEAGDYETTRKPHELISFSPVRVLRADFVENALEALLAQEQAGALEIIRYRQMTEKSLAWVRREEKETILKHGLLDRDDGFARYMKGKYPLSWQDALAERG